MITLIDKDWDVQLLDARKHGADSFRLMAPFIKTKALMRVLPSPSKDVRVLTRFNLNDFAAGVSDTLALRSLVTAGATVRGVKNLHSKLYVYGNARAIVTSANVTEAALKRNHEFGFVSDHAIVVGDCAAYFEKLWDIAGDDLTFAMIDAWDAKLKKHKLGGGNSASNVNLGDDGVDANIPGQILPIPTVISDAPQALIKIFGTSRERITLDSPILEEIIRAGCHWALTYPRRPRRQVDGAVVYIARQTKGPNDMRVFGRAIAIKHVEGRDDATESEKAERAFKTKFPYYVRVHDAKFLDGPLANGISVRQLMSELGSSSFQTSKENAAKYGDKPGHAPNALKQQPDVELTDEGHAWLADRFQAALDKHGAISPAVLRGLDWPLSV